MKVGIRTADAMVHMIQYVSTDGNWVKIPCKTMTSHVSEFNGANGETTITEDRDDLVITGAMCPECAKEIREFIDDIRLRMARVQTDIFVPHSNMS